MERITRFRAGVLLLIFCLIAGFFALKLYDLQIIQTGGNTGNVTTFTTYTRVKAARGDILDRNGNALVSNRASYNLVFNYFVIADSEDPNDSLRKLVKLCQEQEIDYIEHFPVTKSRPFEYTLEDYSTIYQGYFQAYLANRNLDSDISAPLLMRNLRKAYKIPDDWSDEDARLVIGLRYELALRGGITNLPNYIFIEDANDKDLSAIRELNIPGLNVEPSTVREYNTEYAAHILGYVGPMNAEQWEYYQNIDGYEMDSEVGQDGLEAAFEEEIHGVDGLREDVVTADGTVISTRYITEPQAGNNVEVSIDLSLQMVAEDALADTIEKLRADEGNDGSDVQGAAVVAMEVKTGEVLVCGSYPTYDLSTFFENYEAILAEDYGPLFNRALMGQYPPGSTYKMSMVVAAINAGAINSESTITDQGQFTKYASSGFHPNCLVYTNTGGTHGTINAAQALEVSCNYFFYVLGDQLPLQAIDDTAKGLGLGESTGIELFEYTGHRANAETKKALYSGSDAYWYPADQILGAIGQSENRFTPLQLCVYASTLANQGKRYRATFMNRVVSSDYRSLVRENEPELLSTLEIKDEAYQTCVEGMRMVSRTGTASGVFAGYPIDVAAKTGTADTDKLDASANGAFVCFAPADDPQIAIAIYAEQAGHGSSLASCAKAILDAYFDVGETGEVSVYENQIG